jgi:hypothetical protein
MDNFLLEYLDNCVLLGSENKIYWVYNRIISRENKLNGILDLDITEDISDSKVIFEHDLSGKFTILYYQIYKDCKNIHGGNILDNIDFLRGFINEYLKVNPIYLNNELINIKPIAIILTNSDISTKDYNIDSYKIYSRCKK